MSRLILLIGDLFEVKCSKSEAWRRIYAGVGVDDRHASKHMQDLDGLLGSRSCENAEYPSGPLFGAIVGGGSHVKNSNMFCLAETVGTTGQKSWNEGPGERGVPLLRTTR